jgi:hypothetical protein
LPADRACWFQELDMTTHRTIRIAVITLMLFGTILVADDKHVAPDLSKVDDANAWKLINGHATVTNEEGKPVVHLNPIGGNTAGKSNNAFALLQGIAFEAGVSEVDLKGNAPPASSFLGIAFNVEDENHFEAVYFRPFNFTRDGATDHAVQYVAHPDHPWKELREHQPGIYEAKVDPVPDPTGWFHARIVITRDKVSITVSVSVNDHKSPCLVVDRLNAPKSATIGLFVDSQRGAFRDLRIRRSIEFATSRPDR